MKWAYNIKYKLKAAGALAIILLTILTGNFLMRERFSQVDDSMLAIFNDRLKPSVYIYEISHHLYEKRLLLANASPLDSHSTTQLSIQQHDKKILQIQQQYEETKLTNKEHQSWLSFKGNLSEYNRLEKAYFSRQDQSLTNISLQLSEQFDKTMSDLHMLNGIQMSVGSSLQKDTHATVGSTLLLSSLEISLLIVLGLITLIILNVTDNTLFKTYTKNVNLN